MLVSTLCVDSFDHRDVSRKVRPFCSARVTLQLDLSTTVIDHHYRLIAKGRQVRVAEDRDRLRWRIVTRMKEVIDDKAVPCMSNDNRSLSKRMSSSTVSNVAGMSSISRSITSSAVKNASEINFKTQSLLNDGTGTQICTSPGSWVPREN